MLQDEAAFQRLADFVPQIMWMADATGKPLWRNRMFYEYTGYTLADEANWDPAFINEPEALPKILQNWQHAVQTGEPFRMVINIKGKDGIYRPFLTQATPTRDEQGNIIRWFGVNTEVSDQRAAELAARESEERFRTLADASPFMIWVVDENGKVKYHNKALIEFTGCPEETLMKEGWQPLVHPDDLPTTLEKFQESLRNQIPFKNEFRLRRKDGEYLWTLTSGAPHFDSQNRFIGLAGSSVLIHERKLAESALLESEGRFRAMADSAPLFIWLSGPDGFTTYVNKTWTDFLGLNAEEVITFGMRDAMLPEDFERHRQEYRAAFNKRESFTIECRMRNAQGELRWILNKGAPLFLPDGSLAGYIGTSMDITERRAMEDQLHASLDRERLVRRIVEIIGQSFDIDLILKTVAEEVGRYLDADRCSVSRYWLKDGELDLNMSAQYVREGCRPIDPEDLDIIVNAVRHLSPEAMTEGTEQILNITDQDQYIAHLRERMKNLTFELPGLDTEKLIEIVLKYEVRSSLRVNIYYRGTPYGSISVSQCSHNRIWTPDEVELLKTIADHAGGAIYQAELYLEAQETARKESEARQELESYAYKLELSNRELEQFATIASHDLQEPLRKIQIFGEMIQNNVSDDSKEYLGRMRAAANRMQTLIEDLLTLSRVNRKVKPFGPVNLSKIVKLVQEDLQIRINEADAEIQVDPLALVYGDESQIRQLLQNLVGNALKYTRENARPKIRISGEHFAGGNQYRITVSDNGIGIKPEHLDRVFEPFQRLHGIDQYPGTGIGLTICQKIVQRHNGTLTVESTPGEGSRFSFTLPVKPGVI